MMFGVQFVNNSLKEFRLLTKPELCDKYATYLDHAESHYDVDQDDSMSRNERIVIKYNMSVFYKIKVSSAEECVERCFVPDIWFMYAGLKMQMDRDHLTEIELAAAHDADTLRQRMTDETRDSVSDYRRKYEQSVTGVPAYMIRQFANMETMSTLDEKNCFDYDRLLSVPRQSMRAATSMTTTTAAAAIADGRNGDTATIVESPQSEIATTADDDLKINRFLRDLSKRQTKP